MSKEVIKQQTQALAIVSNEKFLQVFSPENCLLHASKIRGLADAMERKTVSLGEIRRERGEAFERSYVLLWLVYINEVLNLRRPMSETQMRLCAETILTDYSYLKVSEMSYIFNKIISGEYGEFYESFTQAKLLSIFREYDKERTDFVIDQNEREHREFRYAEDNCTTEKEQYQRMIRQLLK